MGRESHGLEKDGSPLAQNRLLHPTEASMQFQEFSRGQPLIETEIFRQKADFPSHGYVIWRGSQYMRSASTRLHKAKEHLYGSAFPGAIRSQEAEDLTASHSQREVADSHFAPVYLTQTLRLDRKTLHLIQKPLLRSVE